MVGSVYPLGAPDNPPPSVVLVGYLFMEAGGVVDLVNVKRLEHTQMLGW